MTYNELIETIEKLRAVNAALLDAAIEAADYIDDYVDVVDGDYGEQLPNKAMKAHIALTNAILKADEMKWSKS